MNNENNRHVSVIELGALTADGDVFGLYFPRKSKVVGAWMANGATVAASDTDYFQVSLLVGSTVIAELDTRAAHENGVTANVPKAMNLVAAAQEVAAGSYAKVTYNEEGTMALTAQARVIVEWFPY